MSGPKRTSTVAQVLETFDVEAEEHAQPLITDALNEVYDSEEPAPLDPVLDRMQRASLPREPW